MKRREEKNTPRCFRSTRMYSKNDTWYFKTREEDVVGPFRDELEASVQLEVYIRLVEAGLLPAPAELRADALPIRDAG